LTNIGRDTWVHAKILWCIRGLKKAVTYLATLQLYIGISPHKLLTLDGHAASWYMFEDCWMSEVLGVFVGLGDLVVFYK
jgi:hypothetical protein